MNAVVLKSYQRPYADPIVVKAGDELQPDFEKHTDLDGWVWCTAQDGRAGWTPRNWMLHADGVWHIKRDFSAIELTIESGQTLDIFFEESSFYWAQNQDGETGWVPCENVSFIQKE